jgi:plasmid stabilization system protein ParE
MPDFHVLLDEEATRNIEAIYQWIAERSVEGATRWYSTLTKAMDELSHDAGRFPVAPESRHFGETVRNLTFRMRSGRTYQLLFTIVESDVHVLFVRGPGQDWVTP